MFAILSLSAAPQLTQLEFVSARLCCRLRAVAAHAPLPPPARCCRR
jgi:hypothetical protein